MLQQLVSGGRAVVSGLLGLCVLSACAGNGPAPAGTTSTFDEIQQTIFTPHCLSGGCHNATDRAGNLVLAAGSSYANLVNVSPLNQAAQTMGLLRVLPGQPDQSFLYIKLTLPGAGVLGSPMPLVGSLSAADIQMVRLWILNGAPNSTTPAATPTPTLPPATATATASPPATATASPSVTSTAPPSATPTGSPSATLTASSSATPTVPPSATATASPPVTATASPSVTPTASPSPSPSPSP